MGMERDWYSLKERGEWKREQQRASSPGIGLHPVELSIVWLWAKRRGWRLLRPFIRSDSSAGSYVDKGGWMHKYIHPPVYL